MEDLVQFGVLIFVLVVWLLGGSKKRTQRPPAPRPPAPRPQGAPPRERPRPLAAPAPQARRQPESLAEILDLLRGEMLPPEPERYELPEEPDAAETAPEDLRPLESTDALDAATHERFHERFVDAEPVGAPLSRVRRYRLTPRTARDAVVWTAIFSRPKGLE